MGENVQRHLESAITNALLYFGPGFGLGVRLAIWGYKHGMGTLLSPLLVFLQSLDAYQLLDMPSQRGSRFFIE